MSPWPCQGAIRSLCGQRYLEALEWNRAAFRHFLRVRKLIHQDAVVVFHDANLIFDALLDIEALLGEEPSQVAVAYLTDTMFAVAFGSLARPAGRLFEARRLDRDASVAQWRRMLDEEMGRSAPACGRRSCARNEQMTVMERAGEAMPQDSGSDPGSVFGPDYYATHCGPVPYDRAQEQWLQFFGGVAEHLIRAFAPKRVFDAGCAHGFLVEALRERGVEAYGRDISTFAISQVRPDLQSFCEVGSIAEPIAGTYDLVTCIEVLEHMPEEAALRAIASMTRAASTILFSSSSTDVQESTHINVRPTIYWLRAFAEHGFAPLADFDATFVTVDCFVLRKASTPPSDEELCVFAERVRLRVRCSELELANMRMATEVDELQRTAQIAQERAAFAESEAEVARAQAQLVSSSTTWRATAVVRRMVSLLPARVRRHLRRAAKAAWWAMTPWRLPQRLAAMKARVQQEDLYQQWIRHYDTLNDEDRAAIQAHVAGLTRKPLISVVMPVYNAPEAHLREAIDSVLAQLYPHWELCIADDASSQRHVRRVLEEYCRRDARIRVTYRSRNGHISAATNTALEGATGEFVVLLDHDDLLSERALYEIAVEINAHPDADVIYSDSDSIDAAGRRWGAYFKTDWNPELMLGHNMVSHLGAYRRSLLTKIGGLRIGFEGSQDYDLMLRASEVSSPERIRHIPSILYHWRRDARSPSYSEQHHAKCVAAARRAIAEHLRRTGIAARVEAAPGPTPGWSRVVYELPAEPPLVSVIVPTRDRAERLRRCVDGILENTAYPRIELLIVDSDSAEPDTLELLEDLAADSRVRILRHPGPFNFAAMNNHAVAKARGEIIVLMNDDVEVISPAWLEEMVVHALRPEVGAVGAKLLYPDGTVQHAGVVLGIGEIGGETGAGHFSYRSRRDEIGYFGFLVLTRRVSAVTGACMALRKSVYQEVNGMDDVNLAVAYSDVDLCLRLGEKGYAIVWTPHAELYHHETASRGADVDGRRRARWEREVHYLRQRWGGQMDRDPFYNDNCAIGRANFEPGFPPRRQKPWLTAQPARDGVQLVASSSTPPPAATRAEQLLAPIDRSARILEIGPSYNPIAPRRAGWNTSIVDHATRSELATKYTGHEGVDVSMIEEVDFVWTSGLLTDAVPRELHGTYDALVASHVIEHTTDFVGFLSAAEALVSESGIVILAVPDKRYCFDYFRPATMTGEVLEANAQRRSRHTRRIVFDQTAYCVKSGGNIAWAQAPVEALTFVHRLEDAWQAFTAVSDDPAAPYVDMHAWQFTPSSFELLLLELARLGKTDWQIQRITPAMGCEFHVWLRRGGAAAARALPPAELEARRLDLLKKCLLDTRAQIDFLIAANRLDIAA